MAREIERIVTRLQVCENTAMAQVPEIEVFVSPGDDVTCPTQRRQRTDSVICSLRARSGHPVPIAVLLSTLRCWPQLNARARKTHAHT